MPILDLRIKKAVTRHNVKLAVLNDQATLMDKYAHLSLRYDIGTDAEVFAALIAAISGEGKSDVKNTGIKATQLKSLVDLLRASKKLTIVYNPSALTGQSVAVLKQLLVMIQNIPIVECGAIPAVPHTNAVGAMDMGILPDYYPGGVSVADGEAVKQKWGQTAPTKPRTYPRWR